MIVFVECSEARRGHASALCGALSSESVALVDGHAVMDVRPRPAAKFERFALLRQGLESLVDLHRSARRLVVAVPSDDAWIVPDLAYWLRRRDSQKAYRSGVPDGDASSWASSVARRLEADDDSLRCGAWAPDPIRVETPRLTLTSPTAAQSRDYYTRIVGTNMFDTLMWDGPARPEELLDTYILFERLNYRGIGAPSFLAIIERACGRMVGSIGARPRERDPARVEIGYTLEPGVHGRGYASEAVGAFVRFLFECRGAERIEAEVFIGNTPSRRVLEKNGFACETEFGPSRCPKRGTRRDEWAFVITRAAWEARTPGE